MAIFFPNGTSIAHTHTARALCGLISVRYICRMQFFRTPARYLFGLHLENDRLTFMPLYFFDSLPFIGEN